MKTRRLVKIVLLAIVGLLVIFGAAVYFFLWQPKVKLVRPAAEATDVALDSTILIRFDKPINRRALVPKLTPDLDGEWSFEEPLAGDRHLFRAIRFIPNRVFEPSTTYAVTLEGITDLFRYAKPRTYSTTLTTQALPEVSSVAPTDGAKGVSPQSQVEITLTGANHDYAEFEIVFDPVIVYTVQRNETLDRYIIVPESPFSQGATYALTINRSFIVRDRQTQIITYRGEPEKMYHGTFTIAPPPKTVTVSPAGEQVFTDEKFVVTFTEAMDSESLRKHFTVSPATEGSLSLSDDRVTATFVPSEKLAFDTDYRVTVTAGAANANGGFFPDDVSYAFRTIGAVKATHHSPPDGAVGVAIGSSIEVTFDQAVDRASAEKAFSTEPAIAGTFSWNERTMKFTPSSALPFDTAYQVRLASGIQSVYGQNSRVIHGFSFRTALSTVKLNVAIDLQDRALSCEAAAIKMALANKGVRVSEDDIMNYVGFDQTPHKGNTWGDAYLAFVGDINGRQNSTGYGVYWEPIAKAASHWRPSQAFTGWTSSQVAEEIENGNAVVVWGVYGRGYEDSWNTPAGKYIYAWMGEHARTVIGFVGSTNNPIKFIINDPYVGQITWTKAQFESNWGIFGKAGVVVR
ncbi:MAG: Ig-like domain-containing protein [Patescibacteria group bacterium]|nr:Ig-like domain-containing protein [Patescibacteria group bacterium]